MGSEELAVELEPRVEEYLRQESTLTLATASSAGVPHAATVLYVNEGPALYFWMRPSTATARHLEQNPVVSFTIDEYSADLRQTKGVQGSGECGVLLDGETIARVAALFGEKFPSLSPGSTMGISFFRIRPSDLHFIDNSESEGGGQAGTFGADFHKERAFSVFADLPKQEVENISAVLQTIEAEAGEVIARQGGPADKFFIVADGELEVVGEDEQAVATLGRGHFFGETSILRDRPRAASVRATKPTTLLAMERDTFRDIVAQSLETTSGFDELLRARLVELGARE